MRNSRLVVWWAVKPARFPYGQRAAGTATSRSQISPSSLLRLARSPPKLSDDLADRCARLRMLLLVGGGLQRGGCHREWNGHTEEFCKLVTRTTPTAPATCISQWQDAAFDPRVI
jgi:hypothetical protein